jgi:hypothetical protein
MSIGTKHLRFPSALNEAFEALEDLLEGYNYSVFLWHYFDPAASLKDDLTTILRRTLPKVEIVVGSSRPSGAEELVSDISSALRHIGDSGSGPIPEQMQSEKFQNLLRDSTDACRLLCAESRIELFWLKEGHPAYPVFWEFAFAIRHEIGCDILIGSSSD